MAGRAVLRHDVQRPPEHYAFLNEVASESTFINILQRDLCPSATEFALSDQLGISRLVVHRAYCELVTKGLLIRKRAKGTFVAPPSHRSYTVVGPLFSAHRASDA